MLSGRETIPGIFDAIEDILGKWGGGVPEQYTLLYGEKNILLAKPPCNSHDFPRADLSLVIFTCLLRGDCAIFLGSPGILGIGINIETWAAAKKGKTTYDKGQKLKFGGS